MFEIATANCAGAARLGYQHLDPGLARRRALGVGDRHKGRRATGLDGFFERGQPVFHDRAPALERRRIGRRSAKPALSRRALLVREAFPAVFVMPTMIGSLVGAAKPGNARGAILIISSKTIISTGKGFSFRRHPGIKAGTEPPREGAIGILISRQCRTLLRVRANRWDIAPRPRRHGARHHGGCDRSLGEGGRSVTRSSCFSPCCRKP